jgi:hypothetical protein
MQAATEHIQSDSIIACNTLAYVFARFGLPPLKERIASEQATPEEAREYRRVFNILRAKFHAGSLSPENARRLGIE